MEEINNSYKLPMDISMAPDKIREVSNTNDMDEYLPFIKGHEGKKLKAYKPVDTEEFYTIGYGHYGSDVTEDMTITDEQADDMLIKDINKRLPKVKEAIPKFDSMPIEVKKKYLRLMV